MKHLSRQSSAGATADVLLAAGLALWSAVAMTFGDWVWAAFSLRHRAPYGLAHGTLLCLWMGLYLGGVTKRILPGVTGGAAIGFLAAANFYALAPLIGFSAMFVSWMLLWFGLALLAGRLLDGPPSRPCRYGATSSGDVGWLARGGIAAIGSGVAFYAISGIWTRPAAGANYAWHFAAWTAAFLPGSLALLVRTRQLRA